MIDGLPSDGIIMAVQGDGNMGGVLEFLNGGIRRGESISGEEHEF